MDHQPGSKVFFCCSLKMLNLIVCLDRYRNNNLGRFKIFGPRLPEAQAIATLKKFVAN